MTITIGFDPIIAQLGPFQLGWHGVLTAIAVLIATQFGMRSGALAGCLCPACVTMGAAMWAGMRVAGERVSPFVRSFGMEVEGLDQVLMWAIPCGIIGARAFHVFDNLSFYAANPLAIFAVWEGGIAVYGAFIAGIAGGLFAAWRARLPIWRLLDAAAPAMLLGQAIGRFACLSNGDAWGAPCAGFSPLCLVYTNPHDLLPANLLGVPTYPYPLYEMLSIGVLLVALRLARHRLRRPGMQFLAATLGYGVIRFGLTFYRQEAIVLWGLQEAQVLAVVTVIAASVAVAVHELVLRQQPQPEIPRIAAI